MMTVRIAITFGQKYNPRGSDERHPASPQITGSSYVVFEGTTWEDARVAAVNRLGTAWAFDYLLDDKFAEQIEQFGLVEVKLLPADASCPDCTGRGEYAVEGCTCGAGDPETGHEPGCGFEQCHCGTPVGDLR